ncbi:MAG: DUF512 domain-containing protein [Clostridia bacterium]|nr:DUF512 domain-containing protein [Clostridia bacterium]
MSVVVKEVVPGSYAEQAGIEKGSVLVSINGREIMDVLDYRFLENERRAELSLLNAQGVPYTVQICKPENADFGLGFDTYLMDKQHACKNKCIFCFIDQLPCGMRESLYFKDDDSRLSFLFGNYITLTNLTEHEVARILDMHISPVNISVHTTDPELRVAMMKNKNAGKALDILYRLAEGGIRLNCQLVLCPGYNDGENLRRTLTDLMALDAVQCIAAVPVGLTDHRQGLPELKPFDKKSAKNVLNLIEEFGNMSYNKCGSRRVFAADEFYLLAGQEIPPAAFYEEFAQLENGVGLWALLLKESREALSGAGCRFFRKKRRVSIATGVASAPLLQQIAEECNRQFRHFEANVYPIVNDFFGHNITVSGLVTGQDLIAQLKGRDLGDALLFPAVMLRNERDIFLDDVSVAELSQALGLPCIPVENNGEELIAALKG